MGNHPEKDNMMKKNKSSSVIHTKSKTEKEDLFMRTIWLAMMFLFASIITGCQMGDRTGDETGKRDTNVERTRYQDDADRTMPQNRRDNIQRRDRADDRYGMTRRDSRGTADPHSDNRRDNRSYDIQKEAAEKIVDEIDEINYAYVLTNNRNAYVAAVLDEDQDRRTTSKNERHNDRTSEDKRTNRTRDEGEQLTDEVKREIKDIVQSVDKNIDNVYVSTNPDFADLTNNYINDFNEGKPVRGMFDQLGNMIERLFPQNRR